MQSQIDRYIYIYIYAMRVFNKVLKTPFAYLREQGLSSVVYVDDTLSEDTFEECQDNFFSTLTCLKDLFFSARYHISWIPN